MIKIIYKIVNKKLYKNLQKGKQKIIKTTMEKKETSQNIWQVKKMYILPCRETFWYPDVGNTDAIAKKLSLGIVGRKQP